MFKPKRSNTADAVPTTEQLAEAEIAVNTVDGKIYSRDNDDNIVLLGGLYSGAGLPTSDPETVGTFWNNSGVLTVSAG